MLNRMLKCQMLQGMFYVANPACICSWGSLADQDPSSFHCRLDSRSSAEFPTSKAEREHAATTVQDHRIESISITQVNQSSERLNNQRISVKRISSLISILRQHCVDRYDQRSRPNTSFVLKEGSKEGLAVATHFFKLFQANKTYPLLLTELTDWNR